MKEAYVISNDVEHITWERESGGYRLPTEAEWQYACKAGTTCYQYGELNKIAWYNENSDGQLHAVGTKEPNAWGLYDMLGNVWQWCWDLYDEQVYGSYRIFQGGSWAEEVRDVELPVVVAAILHLAWMILNFILLDFYSHSCPKIYPY